jgi:thiamine transporter
MRNTRILILVEVALAVALAAVFNLLAMRLPINVAGGSISFTMLPIAVVALRRGALAGAAAGTLFGLIDLLVEPFILVPAQVLLDYPVPYLLFGLGVGLFSTLYNKTVVPKEGGTAVLGGSLIIVVSMVIGWLLRVVSHVLSGVLFFAEYAGDQNVWLYSIVYNLSYLVPSLIASLVAALIILPILARAVPPAKATSVPG